MDRRVYQTNRRCFLKQAGITLVSVGTGIRTPRNMFAESPELEPERPYKTLTEALQKAREIGIGSAKLVGQAMAEVNTYGTWTIVYTAGKAGVQPGGGIRIGVRHMNHLWTKIQHAHPGDDGFVSVISADKIPVTVLVECTNWSEKFFNDYHPVQNIVEILVGQPGLIPGQTIHITYGDKTGASQGMLLQPFDEQAYEFKIFVDAAGNHDYLPMANNPAICIRSGKPARLSVCLPSYAVKGIPETCLVRAEDRFGNPAQDYRGTIAFTTTDASAQLPLSYTFEPSDKGVHRFEETRFESLNIQSLPVTDGNVQAESNPVFVSETLSPYRLLWGDLHGHTIFSDGRGTIDEYYDFARNVTALDFCAASDHAFQITDAMWHTSKEATNRWNEPGKFVTFNAYEWSGMSDVGGDHNVYWLDDDPPIYRSMSFYSPRNLQMTHDKTSKIPHIRELYNTLRSHLRNKNVFCIPHKGGRAANPEWHDPLIQRLVETYCEHFRSEEWASQFLQKGYRLGIMASSDDHYGNPGYGFLYPRGMKRLGEGVVAVFAEEHTRTSIFTALYDRHCYATTGDRIILDFQADGHLMGSEYRTTNSPEITIQVAGTANISLVEIRKNGSSIYKETPDQKVVELHWQDLGFRDDETCYYTVHVVQQNHEEALSSPIWVN